MQRNSQRKSFDLSFSGLKTAFSLKIQQLKESGQLESLKSDACASIQAAIVGSITPKIEKAVKEFQLKSVVVVGGVSANSYLRANLPNSVGVPCIFPDLKYSTDNAAMIANAGRLHLLNGHRDELSMTVRSRWPIGPVTS